jgi:antitoxin (DNA-binding transcriptional repressor) of toxin-antitoxin stability system
MSKATKYFELFSALRAGGDKGVSPAALQKATGFNQGALAVYIHALRHQFGAVIESVRNGRTVTAYRLTNADELASKILPTRKPRTIKAKAKTSKAPTQPRKGSILRTAKVEKVTKAPIARDDGSIPVLDADLDIAEIGASELDDIRHSLGI